MSKNDPYRGSPYDAAGMPLGAETVDYDNKDDVAKHTVKDKVVEPPSVYEEMVYEEPKIARRVVDPAKFNSAIELPGKKTKDVGEGIPELQDDFKKPVDIEKEADNPDDKDDFMEVLKNAK